MDIYVLVDRCRQLMDTKEALSEAVKQNNSALEEAKNALAQAMIDEESPKISRNGFLFSLQAKTKYNKVGGCDETELFDALRSEGVGDIIRETVNTQTLQGTMSELVEKYGELPIEFDGLISVYEHYDIMRRKETNKAAMAAKKK